MTVLVCQRDENVERIPRERKEVLWFCALTPSSRHRSILAILAIANNGLVGITKEQQPERRWGTTEENPVRQPTTGRELEGRYDEAYLKEAGKDAPKFTDEEMKIMGSPLDFVGIKRVHPGAYSCCSTIAGATVAALIAGNKIANMAATLSTAHARRYVPTSQGLTS
jgi:hypothetical protein